MVKSNGELRRYMAFFLLLTTTLSRCWGRHGHMQRSSITERQRRKEKLPDWIETLGAYLIAHPESLGRLIPEAEVAQGMNGEPNTKLQSTDLENIVDFGHAAIDLPIFVDRSESQKARHNPPYAGDFGVGYISVVYEKQSRKKSIRGDAFGTGSIATVSPSSHKTKRWEKHTNKWKKAFDTGQVSGGLPHPSKKGKSSKRMPSSKVAENISQPSSLGPSVTQCKGKGKKRKGKGNCKGKDSKSKSSKGSKSKRSSIELTVSPSSIPSLLPSDAPTKHPSNFPTLSPTISVIRFAPGGTTIAPKVGKRVGAICVPTLESDVEQENAFQTLITVTAFGTMQQASAQLDVVFSLDSSGSMAENDPSNLRISASQQFLQTLDDADRAGLVSYDDYIDFSISLSSDMGQLSTQLSLVDSEGGTNLDAGLQGAVQILDESPPTDTRVRTIIFLSDGDGTYTPCNASGSFSVEAAIKGYVIYAVGLGNTFNEKNLRDMAECTGGIFVRADTAYQLVAVFEKLRESILESTFPYNVDVVEQTTANVVVNENSVMPGPSSFEILSSGETRMVWKYIDTGMGLSPGEIFTFRYNAYASGAEKIMLLTSPDASVEFTDRNGRNNYTVPLPQRTIDVNQPPDTIAC